MMKKTFGFLLLWIFVFGFTGCSLPGNYMSSSYSVSSSHTNLAGRLLHTRVIPIDNNFLYSMDADALKAPYKYRVGPYDVLNIIVWNHPELTLPTLEQTNANNLLVDYSQSSTQSPLFSQLNPRATGVFIDTNGEIVFPLIGQTKVAKLSTDQVQDLLAKKLARYIRNPKVGVQVIAFNSQRAHVLGEVMQPGLRPLTDRPLTILDAISLCGGINVKTADVSNIYIIRSVDLQNILVYRLNARSPQNLLVAEQFRLANNDIIYVPPAGVVSWNRAIDQILPSLQTIWYTRSLVRD